MDGVGNFFREVARGSRTREAARLDQTGIMLDHDYKRGRADNALTEARLKRDEELQRLAIADSLAANGMPAEQAGVFSTMLRSGAGNLNQVAQGMGQIGQNAGMEMAQAAMQSGSWEDMNRGLAVYQGKPVTTSKITEGMAFNPYSMPDQPMQVTPVGEATIGRQMAEAAKARMERDGRGGAAPARVQETEALFSRLAPSDGETDDARWLRAYDMAKTRLSTPEDEQAARFFTNVFSQMLGNSFGDAQQQSAQQRAASFTDNFRGNYLGRSPAGGATQAAPVQQPAEIDRAVRELGPERAAVEFGLPTAANQADVDALPPGTFFRYGPDGGIYQKPGSGQ